MAHFYLNEELGSEYPPGSVITLTGAEARHALTVSRARVGERLLVGNGSGLTLAGRVVDVTTSAVRLEVERSDRVPAPTVRITLAQALAKGGRDEAAVQAATELGVDRVIPWQAERSVSRWQGNKVTAGVERWRAIVREATKQSIRAWTPEVAELTGTKGLAAQAGEARMLVLQPDAETGLSSLTGGDRDLLLVVGPEGGISPAELELFRAAGAEMVRLGDSVLRTSTAGPAAIAVVNVMLGRW